MIKEAKSSKIRTEFAINPKSLTYISKKPTQCNPFVKTEDLLTNFPLLNTKDTKTREITNQLRNTVAQMELDTRQKHKQPQSTSMEIGWFHGGDPRFEIRQAEMDENMNNNNNNSDKNKQQTHQDTMQFEKQTDKIESESNNKITESDLKTGYPTKKRWHYPLSQTSVTRFAQHYTLTMGHNPFKSKAEDPAK